MRRQYSLVFAGIRTFVLLGTLIYSCAATLMAASPPPQNYQGAIAESPLHQPDDYWIYQRADGSTMKVRARSYPMTIDFPLWLGRTWSYSGYSLTQGQSGPSNATRVPVETTCEVAALKSISVPAGTFEAFECNCTCKVPADYFRRECGWQKLWYAPAVKNVIQVRGDSTASALDLVEYKVGDKASRSAAIQDVAPKDADGFDRLGGDYRVKGEYDRAIENYTEAIRLDPSYATAFVGRGNSYYDKKDFDRAIQDYTEAIKLKPNAAVFNNRGNAYRAREDSERAFQDYNEAIHLDPNNALAFNNRGNAYRDRKDYERATKDYNRAIQLDPSYAVAFNNRGLLFSEEKNYDRAIQDYDQAIRLNPKYAAAFYNRGIAYRSKGDSDRAIADYDQAIHLSTNYPAAFNNRGNVYAGKGDYTRALQDYDQAIRQSPQYALAFRNRGRARFYQDQFAAAVLDFAKSAEIEPSNLYSALWLYLAETRAGQNGRAGLENRSQGLNLNQWPGPVVDFYLGKIDEKEIYAAVENRDAKKNREQICEANFYLAEAKLLKNAITDAIPLLRSAEKECPPTFIEGQAVRAELKRLGY
jgi:lipoprotein NlpI